MRLTKKDSEAISAVAKSVFGENTKISLFGSRTDNSEKGGDIDLIIQCNSAISGVERYELKIKFLVQLKKIIGDQKIDVLIEDAKQQNSVFNTIRKESITL
jgi:predicted nucleotidyltransferase